MCFKNILFPALFLTCLNIQCQEKSPKLDFTKLRSLLETSYQKNAPGISLMIAQEGKSIYEFNRGVENIITNTPISDNTSFHIGSITKQFTAACILLLEERKKVKTIDYIGQYLNGFPSDKYPVTISHLLTHSSGIPSTPKVNNTDSEESVKLNPSQIMNAISGEPLGFEPGSKYQYSNNGYILLGLIIEKVSGLSYEEFLQKEIFTKLGMENTYLSSTARDNENLALGYEWEVEKYSIPTNTIESFSEGGIISTLPDLNKWSHALFTHKIISNSSLDKMLQNRTLADGKKMNVAYGWDINTIQKINAYDHSGAVPGYKCNSIYLSEQKIYIIACQNTEKGSPTPFTIYAAAEALGKPYPYIADKTETDNDSEVLQGTYLFDIGERYILKRNHQLFYKAPGGLENQLYNFGSNKWHFTNTYRSISLEKSSETDQLELVYENRNYRTTGRKIAITVPETATLKTITETELKKYPGIYKSEEIALEITMSNGALYAQPPGSDKLELKSQGNNKFLIEEIGAEILFNDFDSSQQAYQSIEILLEGNKIIAKKQKG